MKQNIINSYPIRPYSLNNRPMTNYSDFSLNSNKKKFTVDKNLNDLKFDTETETSKSPNDPSYIFEGLKKEINEISKNIMETDKRVKGFTQKNLENQRRLRENSFNNYKIPSQTYYTQSEAKFFSPQKNFKHKTTLTRLNINNNNNKYNYSNKYKLKRNYYTLLNQTPLRVQKASSNIINTNYNINFNNINNKIEEVNSRNNINEKRNIENTKGEERNKLELKTVDQIAEELLNSKDQEELKKYLFIQLLFLNEKYKKDRIFQKIKEQINLLDKDYLSLDKCQKTIPRPINKNKFKISELDNKNSELNKEIEKKKESIQFLEYIGSVYFNISKIKKLDLN